MCIIHIHYLYKILAHMYHESIVLNDLFLHTSYIIANMNTSQRSAGPAPQTSVTPVTDAIRTSNIIRANTTTDIRYIEQQTGTRNRPTSLYSGRGGGHVHGRGPVRGGMNGVSRHSYSGHTRGRSSGRTGGRGNVAPTHSLSERWKVFRDECAQYNILNGCGPPVETPDMSHGAEGLRPRPEFHPHRACTGNTNVDNVDYTRVASAPPSSEPSAYLRERGGSDLVGPHGIPHFVAEQLLYQDERYAPNRRAPVAGAPPIVNSMKYNTTRELTPVLYIFTIYMYILYYLIYFI